MGIHVLYYSLLLVEEYDTPVVCKGRNDQSAEGGKAMLNDLKSQPEGGVLSKMMDVFKARGDKSGPLQLIKVGRALLNSAGVDFRTYKQTSDASARQHLQRG